MTFLSALLAAAEHAPAATKAAATLAGEFGVWLPFRG